MFKIFIILDDVDENNGPLFFFDKATTKKLFQNFIKTEMNINLILIKFLKLISLLEVRVTHLYALQQSVFIKQVCQIKINQETRLSIIVSI